MDMNHNNNLRRSDIIDDILETYSYMYFPDDTHLREEYVCVNKAHRFLSDKDKKFEDIVDNKCIEMLIKHTSSEKINSILDKKCIEAEYSGNILIKMVWMFYNGIPEPSLRKAFYFFENYMNEGSKRTEATLRKYWENYKHVSHLCAASSLVGKEVDRIILRRKETKKLKDVFVYFLSVADSFRKFGESFETTRTRVMLLDENLTYKIPNKYHLEEIDLSFVKKWNHECFFKLMAEYSNRNLMIVRD